MAFGLPVFLLDPAIVEICALAGYDWVSIVAEHAPASIDTISSFQRAADAAGITILVHVAHAGESWILPMLDLGIGGVVSAHVVDRRSAEELVRRVKFAPLGERGAAISVRAARYGDVDFAQYLAAANESTLAGVVIEDEPGVTAIDEILSTPGLDFALLGLTDLSQSLGVPGQFTHPKVDRAMHKVIKSANNAGVVLGTSAKAHSVEELKSLGFRMVMTPTSDTMFLRASLKAHLAGATGE
jgi:4-hydroxy-2-oxoheptanedioate aldolase